MIPCSHLARPALPLVVLAAAAALVTLPEAGDLAAKAAPARSPVIYPTAPRQLRFAHDKNHQQTCNRCHATIPKSVTARDRNVPAEATCRPCHRAWTRADTAVKTGPAARCGRCHLGHKDGAVPARPVRPAANLRFSHRVHLDKRLDCAACHQRSQEGRYSLPTMATCRGCHRKRSAPNRCAVCHLTGKDGRLRTAFAAGKLKPSGALKGDAHNRLFHRNHKAVARGNKRYCQTCHQQRDCMRCHAGTLRPLRIHAGDYATKHAVDARLNKPRCNGCHATQSFCLGCHQRSGVGHETRGGAFRPSTGRRFHTPAFVAARRGPGHHAYAARRNLRTCSGCHRESTCIRCHGSRRRQRGGFSPHGPGFKASSKCRMLAARNQRACLKCHAASDRAINCQ